MIQQTNLVARELAKGILQVAAGAKSEEDLRIGVEKLLEPALKELGITAQPRYEKKYRRTVLQSSLRSDAVYGHAVIEYEPPGGLATARGVGNTTKQLQRYLSAEAGYGSKQQEALRRIVGIGLDGYSIFFLRYRGDKQRQVAPESPLPRTQLSLFEIEPVKEGFQRLGPYQVTEESVSLFLLYLRALRRRPLTPETLAEEFGPKGGIAIQMVTTLYDKLLHHSNTKIETFFSEWERTFGIVYGQDLAKTNRSTVELAKAYGVTEVVELKPLLFTVHSYYALLMKFLAAEFASLQTGSLVSSLVTDLPALTGAEIRDKLDELENGGLFNRLGIRNFLEGDFFGWYLSAWDKDLDESVREMARALSDFEPATLTLEPEATRDLLKKLYQYLVPQELRHDLGEYYTPDWLAELVLNEVGYNGNPDERLIDPACGSGTFLVLAINRVKEYAEEHLLEEREVVDKILANIVGFDLNPLAVISARTNYLLALGNLARHKSPLDIPIYLCDSILTPSAYEKQQASYLADYSIPSVVGEFHVPREIVEKHQVDTLATLLEGCVRHGDSTEEFIERARRQLNFEEGFAENSLAALFDQILALERADRNGIWARIIKNAFAPVFAGEFDYVVGNPPWVNWESLSGEYREATKGLWQSYGLFSLKGHAARLGGGKKDVAMLMLYSAMDNYLRDGGKLGFVITQTVFKTKGAGDGFRRFQLGDGRELKVLKVNDLVELQPFEGASNRTSTVVLEKGKTTEYPIDYALWQKTKPGRITMDSTLDDVEKRTTRIDLAAQPVDVSERTSPWITARPKALSALEKVIGKSDYQAHAGACTWANGVYWLRILERRPDGLLVVENLHDVGKLELKQIKAIIEPDLVYPLLRGRDIQRWQAKHSAYILMVQDPQKRMGYAESWLKMQYPLTYAYLKEFETILRGRSGYKKYFDPQKDPFYSMYDVAEYTFAPYKVMWRQMIETLDAVITEPVFDKALGQKVPVTQHVVTTVSFEGRKEAHYFCALINTSITSFISASYSTSKSFGTPTVLEFIPIPKYDTENPLHQSLSSLSQQAHQLATQGKTEELHQVEEEIDRKAAELWGLSEEELEEIKRSLAEIS